MKNIIVLGAGMVGRAMAIDLSSKYNVTSVDINEESLQYLKSNSKVLTLKADLSEKSVIESLIANNDLVISAVPGFMGYKTLQTIINAGKDVVDISFLPEDILHLNDNAVKNNVTAIVDCGVAPGMPNVILGYYNEKMKITEFEYYVGGLPKVRNYPFEYKAPFSPVDVIEEYTRPARYVENSHIITKPAMSDAEIINFPQVGALEAFNTDGLRSLMFTMSHIPNMKEKTLRYPGHIGIIKVLKAAGFFDSNPVVVKGNKIIPIDLTTNILFNQWKLNNKEEEFTIMRVIIKGIINDKSQKIVYDLFDFYDNKTETSSMARTTGYTATAAADMILTGNFNQKGLFPPELVGKYPQCFEYFINYLKERNIFYIKTEILL